MWAGSLSLSNFSVDVTLQGDSAGPPAIASSGPGQGEVGERTA